jgi:hypothetical protein
MLKYIEHHTKDHLLAGEVTVSLNPNLCLSLKYGMIKNGKQAFIADSWVGIYNGLRDKAFNDPGFHQDWITRVGNRNHDNDIEDKDDVYYEARVDYDSVKLSFYI